jgi:hypothetical protein
MFIIELNLKTTPMSLSVQRKTDEDAQATYQQVLEAMKSGGLIELTCDWQPGKKIAVFGDSLAAVQVYEKSSGGTSSGRSPGFFAMAE